MYEWIKTDTILVKKTAGNEYYVDRLNYDDEVVLRFAITPHGRQPAELHVNGQFYDFGDDFPVICGLMDQVDDLESPVIFHGEAGVWTPA